MVTDSFIESSYKRDNGAYGVIFTVSASIALLLFLIVVNGLPILLGFNVIFFTGLFSFGLIYLLYRIVRNMQMVYEIEISNDLFEASRIIANKKREDLASFSLKDCEYIGPVTSDRYPEDSGKSEFILNISKDRKVNISDDTWYCFVSQSGVKYIVAFTFKDEMYPVFRRYNPRNTESYVVKTTDSAEISEDTI